MEFVQQEDLPFDLRKLRDVLGCTPRPPETVSFKTVLQSLPIGFRAVVRIDPFDDLLELDLESALPFKEHYGSIGLQGSYRSIVFVRLLHRMISAFTADP